MNPTKYIKDGMTRFFSMLTGQVKGMKVRFVCWLMPALIAEIDRQRWFAEAIHDLHMVPIAYNEATIEMAFQNARGMEQAIISGEATIQDRQNSLLEIIRRAQ
jgi:hypothetical protein